MMARLRILIGGMPVTVDVAAAPPLGHRFWRLGGFAGDPLERNPYAGTRCLALAIVRADGADRWLCAMERDASFGLFSTHMLFPSADQVGAEEFAPRILTGHVRRPLAR